MLFQQYLEKGETLILADTNEETQETVILTKYRFIYIKNDKVKHSDHYWCFGKIHFIRCTGRAYDEFLSSEAKKINKNKNIKVLALVVIYSLMCVLAVELFAPLVPFGFVFFCGGLIYSFKEDGKVNKTEWQHRNEIYNIRQNTDSLNDNF